MNLPYPINFIGHDSWVASGYALDLAHGDVITRDGEFLGVWRVVDYDPESDEGGGRYEFAPDGQQTPTITEKFAFLDFRASRGLALSNLSRSIRAWHEGEPVSESPEE